MTAPILPYIVATAGHVDHGKSALVVRLTGIDPDRLPEEKARGITIDLGFAHLDLPSPDDVSPAIYRIGIVDVPGHEDFVHNMVAGMGSVDLAMLVVAADDGWMPQTEEHLQILCYLGVRRAIVALTKSDLPSARIVLVADQIRQKLQHTPLKNAPIVPVSALTGAGIESLLRELARVLSSTPPQPDLGKPRLPVDRAFTLHGVGTIVTGTLTGGTLAQGQTLVIQPAGEVARVRSLQNHNQAIEQAIPGMRVAVNLPDVHPRQAHASAGTVGRGDVVTVSELGSATAAWDVLLERSDRPVPGQISAERALRHNAPVRIHHGAASIPARLKLLDHGAVMPGSRALARLQLDSPTLALAGDRLLIRDASQQRTLAGAVVLDPRAGPMRLGDPRNRAFLEAMAADPFSMRTWLVANLRRAGLMRRLDLLGRSRHARLEVESSIHALAQEKRIIDAGEWLADGQWWVQCIAAAGAAVHRWHHEHPDRAGMPLADLRGASASRLSEPSIFALLVQALTQSGFQVDAATIRTKAHRPALPPRLLSAGNRLRAVLQKRPLDPPSRAQLAPDDASIQALRFLILNGEVIELSREVVISADAFAKAAADVQARLKSHGPATVSELKTVLNTSRRVMVPLLEKLDAAGFTKRVGDQRIAGPTPHDSCPKPEPPAQVGAASRAALSRDSG
jgi:selenocysteine-specific elongation factor